MNDLYKTISQIREDLVPLDVSREEYLAACAQTRINELTSKYDKDFDKLLKMIEDENFSKKDLTDLAHSVKLFSDAVLVLHNNFIRDISKYQKKYFSKDSHSKF